MKTVRTKCHKEIVVDNIVSISYIGGRVTMVDGSEFVVSHEEFFLLKNKYKLDVNRKLVIDVSSIIAVEHEESNVNTNKDIVVNIAKVYTACRVFIIGSIRVFEDDVGIDVDTTEYEALYPTVEYWSEGAIMELMDLEFIDA